MTNKKQKNIPNNWQKIKLGESVKLITKGTTPTSVGFNFVDNGINFIKIESIDNYGNINDKKIAHISNECNLKLKRSQLKEDDILFSIAGALGKVALVKKENLPANTNQALAIIRLFKDDSKINLYFLLYYLNSLFVKKVIKQINVQLAQANLSLKNIGDFKLLLPSLPEQKQIVKILETWDKYLEKLSRKIEIKKNIKKGLMQRLLTGVVRLSGFGGEWESVKLGDIGEIITGNTPPMADKENYGDQYCWATAEDFNGKYINNTNIKLSEKGKKLSRFLPAGSILVTCIASIGKNAIANISLATNQQINSIVVNDKNNNEFIYYLINNSINLLKRYAGAGAMPILNKVTFSKIKVIIPELKEQTAIAEILTTADKEIEVLEKKKKIIEDQKKYLLNNLVTGKIRIPEFIK